MASWGHLQSPGDALGTAFPYCVHRLCHPGLLSVSLMCPTLSSLRAALHCYSLCLECPFMVTHHISPPQQGRHPHSIHNSTSSTPGTLFYPIWLCIPSLITTPKSSCLFTCFLCLDPSPFTQIHATVNSTRERHGTVYCVPSTYNWAWHRVGR